MSYMIDCSHSKKDLIHICDVFNIELLDIYDLNKDELVEQLEEVLGSIDYIEPELEYYFIKDLEELYDYLALANQTKSLSVAGREKVISLARDIIYYTRHGFNIHPKFKDLEEVISTAHQVAKHGDISTCRRALKYLEPDTKIKPSIKPILSNPVRKRLERKEALRLRNVGKFEVTQGTFLLDFS